MKMDLNAEIYTVGVLRYTEEDSQPKLLYRENLDSDEIIDVEILNDLAAAADDTAEIENLSDIPEEFQELFETHEIELEEYFDGLTYRVYGGGRQENLLPPHNTELGRNIRGELRTTGEVYVAVSSPTMGEEKIVSSLESGERIFNNFIKPRLRQ